MKKARFLLTSFLCALICICLSCCSYDSHWMIGKTSAEIEERYGPFHMVVLPDGSNAQADENGLYKNSRGYYLLKEERVGNLGTEPAEYFVIRFDENGIAVDCYEELGGKGG